MPDTDRRRYPRLSMQVAMGFTSGHNFYAGCTRDISAGGLFIETDTAVPVGTKLVVELKFLKKRMKASCEVMWALCDGDRAIGVGVRFLDLRPTMRKSIEEFMARRSPLDYSETLEDEGPVQAAGAHLSPSSSPGSVAEQRADDDEAVGENEARDNNEAPVLEHHEIDVAEDALSDVGLCRGPARPPPLP